MPRLLDMHSHWGTERGWKGNPAGAGKALSAFEKYWNWDGQFMTEAQMAEYFRNNNVSAVLSLAFTDGMPMDEVRAQHDYAFATQKAYPNEPLGLWVKVDPFKPESMAEFRRRIERRTGFMGMVIPRSPPASDPLWEPFYKMCMQASIPILVLVGMSAIGAGVH